MKKTMGVFLALILFLSATSVLADTYKIGVLAKRGPVKALKQWKATGEFLTAKIDGKTFEVVPLSFIDVNPAIENQAVDFFLVNSSMFVTAKVKYGASTVATMVNSRQGQPLKAFGGVVFTSSDDDGISSLEDVKGRSFMAVKKSSFGGWQMAYNEFLNAGIDPFKDFAKLEFGGKHDNVVLAVQNGAAECGTVRTDTLERMAAEGIIDLEEFKIIHKVSHDGFPFVCSTALFPEWPLAKIKKTSDAVAQDVLNALKQLRKSDKAATDGKIIGWVDPLDYTPVEDLQKALKIGAYDVN